MDEPDAAGGIGFLLVAFAIYLFPTLIAFMRGMYGKWGVFLLNLFLGWTGIGWLGALIWSAAGRK